MNSTKNQLKVIFSYHASQTHDIDRVAHSIYKIQNFYKLHTLKRLQPKRACSQSFNAFQKQLGKSDLTLFFFADAYEDINKQCFDFAQKRDIQAPNLQSFNYYFFNNNNLSQDVQEIKREIELHNKQRCITYKNTDHLCYNILTLLLSQISHLEHTQIINFKNNQIIINKDIYINPHSIPFLQANFAFTNLLIQLEGVKEELFNVELELQKESNEKGELSSYIVLKTEQLKRIENDISKELQLALEGSLKIAKARQAVISEQLLAAFDHFDQGNISLANAIFDKFEKRITDEIEISNNNQQQYLALHDNLLQRIDDLRFLIGLVIIEGSSSITERTNKALSLYELIFRIATLLELEAKVTIEDYIYCGSLCSNLNRFEESISYYRKALSQLLSLDRHTIQSYSRQLIAVLNNLALMYSERNNTDDALKYYIQCIQETKKIISNESYQDLYNFSLTYLNIANLYSDIGKIDLARLYYIKSLKMQRSLHKSAPDLVSAGLANTLHNLANFYSEQELLKLAHNYYTQALEIRNKMVIKDRDQFEPDLAHTHYCLGNLYQSMNEIDLAMTHHQIALKTRQKLEKINPERHLRDLAHSYNSLANAYIKSNKYDKALSLYNHAILIREKMINLSDPVNLADLAAIYNNLALLYVDSSQPYKARKLYQKALRIYNRLSTIFSKHNYKIHLANTHRSIGELYITTNKTARALLHYTKAKFLAMQIKKQNASSHVSMIAKIYNDLGILYTDMEKFPEAKQALNRSLMMASKFAMMNPKIHSSMLAQVYHSLGKLYCKTGEHYLARRNFLISLRQYRKSKKNSDQIANLVHDLGLHYSLVANSQFKLKKALALFHASLKNYDVMTQPHQLRYADTFSNMANVLASLEKHTESLRYQKKAERIYRTLNTFNAYANKPRLAMIWHNIGNSYVQLQSPKKAYKYHSKSINLYQELAQKTPALFNVYLKEANRSMIIGQLLFSEYFIDKNATSVQSLVETKSDTKIVNNTSSDETDC